MIRWAHQYHWNNFLINFRPIAVILNCFHLVITTLVKVFMEKWKEKWSLFIIPSGLTKSIMFLITPWTWLNSVDNFVPQYDQSFYTLTVNHIYLGLRGEIESYSLDFSISRGHSITTWTRRGGRGSIESPRMVTWKISLSVRHRFHFCFVPLGPFKKFGSRYWEFVINVVNSSNCIIGVHFEPKAWLESIVCMYF